MKMPTFAFSCVIVVIRSFTMDTPTWEPPFTETMTFSVVFPSGLK